MSIWILLKLSIALFLLLAVPALGVRRIALKFGWEEAAKDPFFLLGGALFADIALSIGYRTLATQVGLPFWPFWLLHLAAFAYWLWRVKAPREQIWHRMIGWLRVRKGRALVFLLGICLVLLFFNKVTKLEPRHYYHDEQLRAAIAVFIPLAYPPIDFEVYSHSRFHYFHFNELLAANLAQTSRVDVATFYFQWQLALNWILIFSAFWAILNSYKTRPALVVLGLFWFFFLIQGMGGDQKISHWGMRQNTFALTLLLLSTYGLLVFLRRGRVEYFGLAALLGSLIVGAKLLALTPLMPIFPIVGLWGWWQKKISFTRLSLIGGVLVALSLGWYVLCIYNPAESAQVALVYEPGGHWVHEYGKWLGTRYPSQLFYNYFRGDFDPFWLWLVLPAFYQAEYLGLFLLGLFVGWRKLGTQWMVPLLMAGGWFSMAIFTLYKFTASGTSIVYFLFFGAWLFAVLACHFFLEGFSERGWSGRAVILAGALFAWSFFGYAQADLRHYSGPENHYRHSDAEMALFKLLRAHTEPTDYVLHNLYHYPALYSFSSMAQRRSVLSSSVSGGIFQDAEVFARLKLQADRFFEGTLPTEETKEFLKTYEVKVVVWFDRFGSPQPMDSEIFETLYRHGGLGLYKVKDRSKAE